MNTGVDIASMRFEDWEQVKEIYNDGIKTGQATFQKEVPTWKEWDKGHLKKVRLVAQSGGQVTGWAALSPVSSRCVYSGVAEVSVYVHPSWKGKGIGNKLMHSLINSSEQHGIWTLQAGIFPENTASLQLHFKHGFRKVGIRERIGKMDGMWRDVLFLERRSKKAGY